MRKEKITERISWWLHHPCFELIYLLGGTPNQHQNVLHYRNIRNVVDNLKENIRQANSPSNE